MKNQEITVQANLVWNISKTSTGTMLGECRPIGLVLEADSDADLKKMINESLHYFFLIHFEDGTLRSFLTSHGWSITGALPNPSELTAEELTAMHFSAPWRSEPQYAA